MTEQKQQEIFDSWLSEYKAVLFKVIRAYAFTSSDQEDLFQEISVQVWRSVPNFREESSPITWIYRIALNTAIKWVRKEQKSIKSAHSIDSVSSHVLEIQPIKNDRLDWLYDQIAKLNEADRSITLLMLDGFSYKEMSGILGISETYVGVKINRIKKHLTEQSNHF